MPACRLLAKLDFADMKFSLIFLGFQRPEDVPEDPGGWLGGWVAGWARAERQRQRHQVHLSAIDAVGRPAGFGLALGCEVINRLLICS
jgi:hypothetical protein